MTTEYISDPSRVRGMIPVQPCPYTADGEVDVEGLKENTRFLAEFAAEDDRDVLILTNGSTSECYANTVGEQRSVVEATIAASGETPVIAGTSRAGTRETIELTKDAAAAGADLAMVVVPYYHIPTEEGLYRHYEKIAEAVDIGIVAYSNPDVSKAWIRPELLERIAGIENVVAAKDNTDFAANAYQQDRAVRDEDISLLSGLGHANYVSKAAVGNRLRGYVSIVGNFAPSLAYELYDAVENGELDRAQAALDRQAIFGDVLDDLEESRRSTSLAVPGWEGNYMYQSAIKAAMEIVGLNGGPVRLPMTNVTDKERERIRTALVEMGVVDE